MKTLIIILVSILIGNSAFSQQIVKKDGQFLVLATNSNSKIARDSTTQYKFKDTKGVVYPVFVSARGKYYYYRVSGTTGNPYKVYLKVE